MNIFGVKRTVKMTGFARPSKARLQAGKIMPFIFFLAVSFVSSSYGQNDTSATTQHQDVSPFLEPSPTVSAKNIQDSHLQTSTVPMATPASSQSNSSDHQAASSSTSIKPEDATTVVPVQSTPIELQGSSLPITTDGALNTSPTAEVDHHSLIPKSSASFVSASSASPSPGDTETIIVLATGDVEETTVWEEGISVSEEPSGSSILPTARSSLSIDTVSSRSVNGDAPQPSSIVLMNASDFYYSASLSIDIISNISSHDSPPPTPIPSSIQPVLSTLTSMKTASISDSHNHSITTNTVLQSDDFVSSLVPANFTHQSIFTSEVFSPSMTEESSLASVDFATDFSSQDFDALISSSSLTPALQFSSTTVLPSTVEFSVNPTVLQPSGSFYDPVTSTQVIDQSKSSVTFTPSLPSSIFITETVMDQSKTVTLTETIGYTVPESSALVTNSSSLATEYNVTAASATTLPTTNITGTTDTSTMLNSPILSPDGPTSQTETVETLNGTLANLEPEASITQTFTEMPDLFMTVSNYSSADFISMYSEASLTLPFSSVMTSPTEIIESEYVFESNSIFESSSSFVVMHTSSSESLSDLSQSETSTIETSQLVNSMIYPTQSQESMIFQSQSELNNIVFDSESQSSLIYPSQSQESMIYPSQSQESMIYPSQSQGSMIYPSQSGLSMEVSSTEITSDISMLVVTPTPSLKSVDTFMSSAVFDYTSNVISMSVTNSSTVFDFENILSNTEHSTSFESTIEHSINIENITEHSLRIESTIAPSQSIMTSVIQTSAESGIVDVVSSSSVVPILSRSVNVSMISASLSMSGVTPSITMPDSTVDMSVFTTSEIPTTSVVSELTSSPSTTVSTETASVTIATVTNETITTTMHGQVTTSPSAEVTTPNIVTITTNYVEVTTVSDTTESLTTVVTSSTVSASTAVTTEALTTADTTTVTELTSTSLPPTTPPWPTLNTSDAFANHWVISVFQVSLDIDVSSLSFVAKMERSLAELYSIAFHRQEVAASKAQRRRRAVTYGNTTAQVINITRSASEPLHTSVVYYLQRLGNITVAAEVAAIMHTLNEQEIAIITELVVISKAEVYVPPPPPPDSYLWIIGAAIGGLIGLIFVIWCLLFIYFKCTRPTHPKTARSPRSVRSIDPEGSFRTKKDIRGFDIVRTEVGLESEIHREKTRSMIEPYRNRDGSTDLEGMYSAGESPPSHLPGKGASLRSQTHSQIGSGGRQLPRGPGNQQKRISKHTSEESEDDPESAATTDSERRPLSKSSRGKKVAPKVKDKAKSKGQPIREESESEEEESGEDEDHDSQAGIYENAGRIAKTNTPQLRTTPHAIRLPPLSQHPLVANHPPSDKEIYESLRDKAEAEKQRNKQRQRDKKKGGKKSKKDKEEIKDPKAKKAYKKVQKEIGAVLGEPVVPKQLPDVFVAQPKKSKKKKAPKRSNSLDPAETSPDSMEMRDLPQAKHPVMQVNGLGHLESDDSENDSNLDENGDPQAFEEARQRMHALLDDAFALIAPHRRNKVAPTNTAPSPAPPRSPPDQPQPPAAALPSSGSSTNSRARSRRRAFVKSAQISPALPRRNDTQTTSDQPETNNEPQHSPMYVNGGKKADAVDHRFNPYNAADEVAKIKDPYPPGVIDTTPETARRSKSPTQKVAAPTTGVVYPRPVSGQDYQYANPAFAGSGKSSPVVLGTKVLPNSHLNPNSVGQKTAQELRQDMQPEDYTSIAMDARMFAPNSNILARSHSPPERDSSETVDMQSSNMPKAGPIISDPSRSHGYHQSGYPIQSDSQSDLLLEKAKLSTKNQSQQNKWANERVSKPFEEQKRKGNGDSNDKKKKKTGSLLEEGDDELDVVERVIQPGMNQEPLVRSIREELQRLARRGNNSDHIV